MKLRILTYNTHLMADSNVVVGAWYKNLKPVVLHDDMRHGYIVNKIRESRADIIGLQEVWSKSRMRRLQQELAGEYPHHALGADGDYMFDYLAQLIATGVPDRASGSGLVLLSKYPLGDVRFDLYPHPHDDDERAASKGLISATVMVGRRTLRIGMTHAWTDAGHDCSNIEMLAGKTVPRSGDVDAVMMGDFNIHRVGNPQKYKRLTEIMDRVGAKDSWTLAHGDKDIEGSFTDDQATNNLGQFFSPMRNTDPADCIDYVFVKSAKEGNVRVESAKVLRDWKMSTRDLSPKWHWVHEGTVGGMPAGTPFGAKGEKLAVVIRQLDGKLRASVCDSATNRWTSTIIREGDRDVIAGGSPGMAWWGNVLHLFFQGGEKKIYKMESTDGLTWSTPVFQGFHTSGGVCAVVCSDRLYVFAKDPGGTAVRFHVFNPGGWSPHTWIGIETGYSISAAAMGDKICVVTKDADSKAIMHVIIEGGKCGAVRQIAHGAETSGSPGVAAFNGHFEVFYREPDGGGLHKRSSADGYRNIETTHQATNHDACPVVWGDRIVLFFSAVVYDTRKKIPGKVSYPEDAVRYPEYAFAHGFWPPDVMLDASDHYPYQVDLVLT